MESEGEIRKIPRGVRQAKVRAADKIVGIFAGQRRMDVRNNSEKFVEEIVDILMGEGLME
jgi:hypothetical protein